MARMAFAFHPMDPRGAGTRLLYSVGLGLIVWFVTPSDLSSVTRALLAGDVGAFALLVVVAMIILRADTAETRRRAAAEDPGRFIVWIVVLGVSAVSLFAATFVMRHARSLGHGERELLLVLGVATAAIAWFLTHAAFTLRYAHLFYRAGTAEEGGIQFPGEENKPDDLDFAYFAFTIGMCFQVSDAQITDRLIRRTATAHALLSFAYNTGILALVINVVLSQLS